MSDTFEQQDAARKAAEKLISAALLELEEKTGRKIEAVDVDTRQFANLRVNIFFD